MCFADFIADSVAVRGEFYEQFTECQHYSGVSDRGSDCADCGELFERCGGYVGKLVGFKYVVEADKVAKRVDSVDSILIKLNCNQDIKGIQYIYILESKDV